MKYAILTAAAPFALVSHLHAAAIAAPSVAYDKVSAAISQAAPGDTVTVPAGTATWTKPLIITKGITLQGAGIGKTIVVDGLQSDDNNIRFVTSKKPGEVAGIAPARYRLTGFEFRGNGLHAKEFGKGTVLFNGSTLNFRLDNCKFNNLLNRCTYFRNSVCGVVDHCVFVSAGTVTATINHDQWPNPNGSVGTWGDGSWASPIDWGGPNAIYFEDNTFESDPPKKAALDGYGGTRFVMRYNTIENMHIDSHGTGSTGRFRGVRQWEIYNNNIIYNPVSPVEAIYLRGGTGVIFNNTINGLRKTATLHTYRYHTDFQSWPGSDGTCAWDLNNPTVYLTGHAATGSKDFTLVVAGANWTANQWVGYTVRDTASSSLYPDGFFSAIISNTKNTIKVESGSQIIDKPFRAGDYFEIRKVMQGLDMIGGSTGDLLPAGAAPTPRWLNQAIEPAYIWNNVTDGVLNSGVVIAADPQIKSGVHFFNNKSKLGYQPFVYPHPLVR
jgi:hypothetical protein